MHRYKKEIAVGGRANSGGCVYDWGETVGRLPRLLFSRPPPHDFIQKLGHFRMLSLEPESPTNPFQSV